MATPVPSGAPLFLLVVLVAAFAMSTALASDNSVNIINDVGNTIQVHCKSGDRDLHPRTLLSGQRFGWGFKSNFWGTTLFHCSFNWGVKHQSVDVWSFQQACCWWPVWTVTTQGFLVEDAGCGKAKTYTHPWM